MSSKVELHRINFPNENDSYFSPESQEEENKVIVKVNEFPVGHLFFCRIAAIEENDNNYRYACCIKTLDKIYATCNNGEIIEFEINETRLFREKIHILNSYLFPTLQLSLHSLPKNKKFEFISHRGNSSELRILIFTKENQIKIGEILFRTSQNLLFIETTELSKQEEKKLLELNTKHEQICTIKITIIKKKLSIILEFSNKDKDKSISIDLSNYYDNNNNHSEQNKTFEKSKAIFVTNIIDSFSMASNLEKKEEILNKLTLLLNKNQTNNEKRIIALESLQKIYKSQSGSFNIINRLWKACKNSFDIQPYHVIDIKDLTLNRVELGSGTFGCVQTGIWNSPNGKIPVAVKTIQENTQAFDLSDLRGEVCFIF